MDGMERERMKVGRETDERGEMEGERDDNIRKKGLH